MTFQLGNKLGGRHKREKLFETALMMELKAAGEDMPSLRRIARNLIAAAAAEEITALTLSAIKEFADRIDGKVPQAIIGGDEDDPALKLTGITIEFVQAPPASARCLPPPDDKAGGSSV